jgi:poly(hydroxyalkanoate) depolymerase family esterase
MLRCSIWVEHFEKAASGMNWSSNLRTFRRGVTLATRIAKAQFDGPLVRPPARGPSTPVPPAAPALGEPSRLVEYNGFGDNPGRLRMRAYVPPAAAGKPLVVLLHGCGQDAAGFAHDSGWTELADRLAFPLILPEQAEANNAGRCFQWFHPSNTARGAGEAGSIAEMTQAAISRFNSDPQRVFVVGLSAGAAMAVALLAAYPDLFAAGASVAGLPVGAARSGMQAIMRMASAGPNQSPEAWAAQVRAAAPAGFAGPWPRLSIWQGQADMTVAPENATLLATQWCALHGLNPAPSAVRVHDGVQHRQWADRRQPLVELWSLPHLTHAWPVGESPASQRPVGERPALERPAGERLTGERGVAPGRFVAQAPVDATAEIAEFFGPQFFGTGFFGLD